MRDLPGRKGFGNTHRRSLVPATILCVVVSTFGCGGGGSSNPVVAVNDTYTVGKGLSISPAAPGVLSNDTGSTLEALQLTPPIHGVVLFNPDGSFTYTHNNDNATSDSFTYRARNSEGSADATVFITINQPPSAKNSCGTIHDNDPSAGVTLSATDPNGNNTIASYTVPAPPSNGTLMECTGYPCTRPSPFFTYVPNKPSSLRGMDKITFSVTDTGGLGSAQTGAVTILNNGELRIMPLGDSITAGDGTGTGDPDRRGYRRPLYLDLTAAAAGTYGINFVGGEMAGPNDFDTDHEGHGGWCSIAPCGAFDGIAGHVTTWLNNNPPDIILLHIGTNDLNPSGANRTPDETTAGVAAVLDAIDNWEALNYPVTVFLAKIIRDVPNYQADLPVTVLNSKLQTMVNNRPSDRVLLVDMENIPGFDYGNMAPGADMFDNVHPNQGGYDKMSAKWLSEMTLPANVSAKFLGLPECQ